MDPIQESLFKDIVDLWAFVEEPLEFPGGDLTHSEVRDMLVLVRRIKTRLEVLDAEMEKN